MAQVVASDRSGRIVIPKNLRLELGIKQNTKFILTKKGHGQLLLQMLNVDEIARKLEEELTGTDVDVIVHKVRKEMNEKIRTQYPDLLA